MTCKKCGYCCTADSFNHDRVDIKLSDIKKWKKMKIWRKIKRYLITTSENESGYAISLDGQNCKFLDKDKLCRLHKNYGKQAKPNDCRKFSCEKYMEVKEN